MTATATAPVAEITRRHTDGGFDAEVFYGDWWFAVEAVPAIDNVDVLLVRIVDESEPLGPITHYEGRVGSVVRERRGGFTPMVYAPDSDLPVVEARGGSRGAAVVALLDLAWDKGLRCGAWRESRASR